MKISRTSSAVFVAGAAMLTVGTFMAGVAVGGAAEAASATTVTLTYLAEDNGDGNRSCGGVGISSASTGVARSSGAIGEVTLCRATFKVLR